ncbi:hypothetical protein BT69DRAFT_1349715, partial [Atractiella rhizophila]
MYRTPSAAPGNPYPAYDPNASLAQEGSTRDSSYYAEATHFFAGNMSTRSASTGELSRMADIVSPVQPQKDTHYGFTREALESEVKKDMEWEDKFDLKEYEERMRKGKKLVGLMNEQEQQEYVKETHKALIDILDSL